MKGVIVGLVCALLAGCATAPKIIAVHPEPSEAYLAFRPAAGARLVTRSVHRMRGRLPVRSVATIEILSRDGSSYVARTTEGKITIRATIADGTVQSISGEGKTALSTNEQKQALDLLRPMTAVVRIHAKPWKTGESRSVTLTVPIPGVTAPSDMTGTMRLLRIASLDGRDAAEIESVVTAQASDARFTASGRWWIDTATGVTLWLTTTTIITRYGVHAGTIESEDRLDLSASTLR